MPVSRQELMCFINSTGNNLPIWATAKKRNEFVLSVLFKRFLIHNECNLRYSLSYTIDYQTITQLLLTFHFSSASCLLKYCTRGVKNWRTLVFLIVELDSFPLRYRYFYTILGQPYSRVDHFNCVMLCRWSNLNFFSLKSYTYKYRNSLPSISIVVILVKSHF